MKGIPSLIGSVAIFFFADGKLLLHTCPFSDALPYGDFLNYPLSHDDVWMKYYHAQYKVDFDYWPRGRIIYNTTENAYIIYCDKCMAEQIPLFVRSLGNQRVVWREDEHYQCHMCNPFYADIEAREC